jgi:hypothetical protein
LPEPSATVSPTNTPVPTPPPIAVATSPTDSLLDAQGQPLPQTRDYPTIDSPSFKKRMDLLFQAIVEDRPELANDAFFPVIAYEQVKDVQKPARDHKYRLMAAFYRNIHEYHRKLARQDGPLTLISVEPPSVKARFMEPGSEGNKLGYYRMLRAHLKYTDTKGQIGSLEITSMISWRGEWYVVHLNGFK